MLKISKSDEQGRCSGQKPRQGYRFPIRWKEKRKKHHHKNAKAKAAYTLNETRDNSQQKYK